MTTAIYIGSGLDMRPIKYLKDIKLFIYIDSLPGTDKPEFDKTCLCDVCVNCRENYYNYNKINYFIPESLSEMDKNNFEMNGMIERNKLTFINSESGVKVKYYINTAFPRDFDIIKSEIINSNLLIMAGYYPHREILKYYEQKELICWEGTIYTKKDIEDAFSNICPFNRIYYYSNEGKLLFESKNFSELTDKLQASYTSI